MAHVEELVMLKVHIRNLKKLHDSIRRSLDSGDCNEYELLDRCDFTVRQINQDLRKLGVDKQKEV